MHRGWELDMWNVHGQLPARNFQSVVHTTGDRIVLSKDERFSSSMAVGEAKSTEY